MLFLFSPLFRCCVSEYYRDMSSTDLRATCFTDPWNRHYFPYGLDARHLRTAFFSYYLRVNHHVAWVFSIYSETDLTYVFPWNKWKNTPNDNNKWDLRNLYSNVLLLERLGWMARTEAVEVQFHRQRTERIPAAAKDTHTHGPNDKKLNRKTSNQFKMPLLNCVTAISAHRKNHNNFNALTPKMYFFLALIRSLCTTYG